MTAETRPFPPGIGGHQEGDEFINIIWSELNLHDLDKPFELPAFSSKYDSVSDFVDKEIKVQAEIVREELSRKVYRVSNMPKEETANHKAEKHLRFPLPYYNSGISQMLDLDLYSILREPPKGVFTNYVVVLQKRIGDSDQMQNLTLAYCNKLQKAGAQFRLGKDYENLASLTTGTFIYVRVLQNFNMLKTHIAALFALNESVDTLSQSFVTQQLLQGCIDSKDIRSLAELDQWISSKNDGSPIDLNSFNKQQQRALALDALTEEGVVLIQGPPGTGKSHIVCHGILPQLVSRLERVMVVCNSNVAVDALMLKCSRIPYLKGKLLRCGFKQSVSDEIVNLGLYAEGDSTLFQAKDRYGNTSGANSNTADANVQDQIRSKQVVFTTIHYASKAKSKSDSHQDDYWSFDTLVLDEAAQIEDSRLFIVLARCPSLKKMILVGDPKQLQPYVSESLRQQKYGMSTMERLMDSSTTSTGSGSEGGDDDAAPYIMLEQQFRMAPTLREVVSHLFYRDRLQDGPNVLGRGPVASVNLQPLLVVNVTGSTMFFNRLHQSYENPAEAAVVNQIYDFLFSADFLPNDESLEAKDVCILTPFNRHKDRLRMCVCGIEEDDLDSYGGVTFGRGLGSPAKKSQALYGTQEEVSDTLKDKAENIDTVDKFQGSERKVVIISTCVDQKPLRAADPHFINVACSRAQHLLVVVGNFTHGLATDSNWSFVWNRAKEHGSYIQHSVIVDRENAGAKFEIHAQTLQVKLQALLQPPSKKTRRTEAS